VLGLGDRHASNILIDNNSAELVHIDLGIAFGAGRLLPTPERVPFRLTRDLEAGLGVCGVEGVMRGAAEQCMRVLRDSTEPLLTVLEVFVRSPLHKWSVSPLAKGAAKQTAAAAAAAAAPAAAPAAAAPPPPPPLVHPRSRRSSAGGGAAGLGSAGGLGGGGGLGGAPGGEGSGSSAGSGGAAAAGEERAEMESSELETTNREAEHVLLETQARLETPPACVQPLSRSRLPPLRARACSPRPPRLSTCDASRRRSCAASPRRGSGWRSRRRRAASAHAHAHAHVGMCT